MRAKIAAQPLMKISCVKRGATSNKEQYFAKYATKHFLLKAGTTNMLHHLRQKHTVNEEEMLEAGDV